MLENIEIEKIIQDIDSGLTDYTIGKKYKHSHNTIANIRKEHEDADAGESQEEAKKQEVHFDNPIDKVRAIPKAIDALIETEQLKGNDRAEWAKRIEDIRRVLRIEVDDRIDEEREDATEISDGQWRVLIKKKYDKKEIAANLRSVLKERDTTIEDLTEEIEEGDEFVASFRDRNTNLIKEIGEKDNLNTNLNNKNIDLNDYIDKYLDDAGRRERSKLRLEKESFAREKTEFDSACMEEQNRLDQERSDLDQYISRLSNWRSKLDQRDKEQNQRNEEQDEQDKKISEEQKLLADQIHKQQIERNELKQKEDALAFVKKDLMEFAGEIGRDLSEAIHRGFTDEILSEGTGRKK